MAKIVSLDKENLEKDDFMDFAGILTEKEGNKVLKDIKKMRNDGSKFKNKLI